MKRKNNPQMTKKVLVILTSAIFFAGAHTSAYAAAVESVEREITGPVADIKGAENVVLNLTSGGQHSITQSGSFEVKDGQSLVLTVRSDIGGGSVDVFLFSPDNREQRFTFYGADETKTVTLSVGRWSYNYTGFFESGDISIVGKIKESV